MNCHLSEITEFKNTSLIKMIILEENFKWHLEAFASELFVIIKRFPITDSDWSIAVLYS